MDTALVCIYIYNPWSETAICMDRKRYIRVSENLLRHSVRYFERGFLARYVSLGAYDTRDAYKIVYIKFLQ